MSELKLPKPYISHSQFTLFKRDPMAYYEQYFVARLDEPTEKMTLGKIFQKAWCDKKYPYEQELKKAGFTSDKLRVIKTALEHPATLKIQKSKTEQQFTVKDPAIDYPILAQLDGLDKDIRLIIENKMGQPWNQARVDTDTQVTWYMLCYKIKYRQMPKFLLQSFNSRNGIPNKFWGKRYKVDFDRLISEINGMVTRIKAGDFEQY